MTINNLSVIQNHMKILEDLGKYDQSDDDCVIMSI